MAPSHPHPNHPTSLFPSPVNHHRHRSKSQTCFFKILHIISVFSPEHVNHNQCLSVNDENCKNRGFDVDENCENVSLRLSPEIAPDEPPAEVGDRSSEIIDSDRVSDEANLGLLIEAAELILGEHVESSPPPAAVAEVGRGTKRTAEWWSEFEVTLPVVKTKRGRTLVLPEKYRDSFIRWNSSGVGAQSPVKTVASRRRARW